MRPGATSGLETRLTGLRTEEEVIGGARRFVAGAGRSATKLFFVEGIATGCQDLLEDNTTRLAGAGAEEQAGGTKDRCRAGPRFIRRRSSVVEAPQTRTIRVETPGPCAPERVRSPTGSSRPAVDHSKRIHPTGDEGGTRERPQRAPGRSSRS